MYSDFTKGKLLSDHSTFGIGGAARYFIEVKEIAHLQKVLHFCSSEKLPFFVLGKGSNCLFSDDGFDGLVILNKIDFCERGENHEMYVGAGFSFSLLGMQTARSGLSGLEFAAGIPASVGGAIFMNAGAQGSETQSVLSEVEFVDEKGELYRFKKEELHFSYRSSPFQKMKGAIAAARFQLSQETGARKKQLELLEYRIRTQPYQDKTAGCVFRNPEGASAGLLIDNCGLKGVHCGLAKVSEMHANFLVNTGKCSAKDMLALIRLVQTKVKEQHGYDLEPEIRIIECQK